MTIYYHSLCYPCTDVVSNFAPLHKSAFQSHVLLALHMVYQKKLVLTVAVLNQQVVENIIQKFAL